MQISEESVFQVERMADVKSLRLESYINIYVSECFGGSGKIILLWVY